MRINLTTVAPESMNIHHAFDEVRESLAWSLTALGHDVSLTENFLSESGERNLILGAELLADFQRLPAGTIIFNLEQPSHPNLKAVRRITQESGAVSWDYSARSVETWKADGFNVAHLPIGYTPNLTRIPPAPEQDLDVFFAGFPTPRRDEIVLQLQKAGLKVKYAGSGCYGGARDQLISRAKVCLNVHHDGRDRFEAVRCSYLMANAKCVVTELSSDDDEYADLHNGLARAPYRMLVETCRSYCAPSASQERWNLQAKALELVQKRDFTVAVKAALDALPEAAPIPYFQKAAARSIAKAQGRREFFSQARELKAPDPCVAARFSQACAAGDMKDFAPWLKANAKGNIMEIGVRDGGSTAAFLAGLEENGGHLYSVDVMNVGHLFNGHPQWTFIHANSIDYQKVCAQIPYEIDLLLIDGDHSRAGVLADTEYMRQVRPGGMVLFHDIAPEEKPTACADMSWPGDDVKRVYESLCRGMAELGWTHEELPGRYGMGVLKRPLPVPEEVSK